MITGNNRLKFLLRIIREIVPLSPKFSISQEDTRSVKKTFRHNWYYLFNSFLMPVIFGATAYAISIDLFSGLSFVEIIESRYFFSFLLFLFLTIITLHQLIKLVKILLHKITIEVDSFNISVESKEQNFTEPLKHYFALAVGSRYILDTNYHQLLQYTIEMLHKDEAAKNILIYASDSRKEAYAACKSTAATFNLQIVKDDNIAHYFDEIEKSPTGNNKTANVTVETGRVKETDVRYASDVSKKDKSSFRKPPPKEILVDKKGYSTILKLKKNNDVKDYIFFAFKLLILIAAMSGILYLAIDNTEGEVRSHSAMSKVVKLSVLLIYILYQIAKDIAGNYVIEVSEHEVSYYYKLKSSSKRIAKQMIPSPFIDNIDIYHYQIRFLALFKRESVAVFIHGRDYDSDSEVVIGKIGYWLPLYAQAWIRDYLNDRLGKNKNLKER